MTYYKNTKLRKFAILRVVYLKKNYSKMIFQDDGKGYQQLLSQRCYFFMLLQELAIKFMEIESKQSKQPNM